MPHNKFRGTWQGPARATQEEALDDMTRLAAMLKQYAPSLWAAAPNLGETKRIPGSDAVNKKDRA